MASLPSASVNLFLEQMKKEGLSEAAMASFARCFQVLESGETGMIEEETIAPVEDLLCYKEVENTGQDVAKLLRSCVLIKLNGGLGTGMGLQKAKSLLTVREQKTFLDLIVLQLDQLEKTYGNRPEFLLMNSFATSADTRAELSEKHPHLGDPAQLELLQNKVPKVLAASRLPAKSTSDSKQNWCPPGHGDLYATLIGSGKLQELLAAGIRYAFVSNSDNLGATLDPKLLAWFAQSQAPFLMEVTRRTAADRKGGHLARRRLDQQLVLRESAQCAQEDQDSFQDISKYKYFNTNSLWIDLQQLADVMHAHGDLLPLPVICNKKTLDPRDANSPEVIQLETAMGAAIECFEGALAIEVPRSRFAPVKTCDDLFVLYSDACEIRQDGSVGLVEQREGIPPTVRLDKKWYKFVDGLNQLCSKGVPSLKHCNALTVEGPWQFSAEVEFKGVVELQNKTEAHETLVAGVYQDKIVEKSK